MKKKILIIGAAGQIGSEVTSELKRIHGLENVVATDIKPNAKNILGEGIFETLDVNDHYKVKQIFNKYNFDQIYHFAAILSATGEQDPERTWVINVSGLMNILDAAKEQHINRIFWPSSIAVFGETTPKINTPQQTIIEPTSAYGISKLAGERWVEYYNKRYDMDIRSIRYPGIVSYKTEPGGGTTDYAIDIFFKAVKNKQYECYLSSETKLPMMYMPDAIKATIDLMGASKNDISILSSYNVGSLDFTPQSLAESIKKIIPEFEISYNLDFRQALADTWPDSIDDSVARNDWNWSPEYSLDRMSEGMIKNIKSILGVSNLS